MALSNIVAKTYTTTLPDTKEGHIFPHIAGRKKLEELTVAHIQLMHSKGKCLDVFKLIEAPKEQRPEADVIADIKAVKSAEAVDAIVGDDQREKVLAEAAKRKTQLTQA